MTEEIIIDGVDVSECEELNTIYEKPKCVILQNDVCFDNQYCEGYNCYYKQLQRLKQENKQYQLAIERFLTNAGIEFDDEERALLELPVIGGSFINLKQENEKLRNEIHSKTEFIQEQRTIIDNYKKEIEMYKQCQGKRASKREEDLRTTLEEVKSMLQEKCTECYKEEKPYSCGRCELEKFLRVINEVLK